MKSQRYQRQRHHQQQQQPQAQAQAQQPRKKLTIVRKGDQPSRSEPASQKFVGTSNEIDKRFVRSTGLPTVASNVRPAPVLEKALDFAVTEYEKTHSYFDFMDRAKAIRQDMTIQGLHQHGDLAKRVYSINGRIALACKDFGEFNVCQNHLLAAYGEDRDQTYYEFLGYKVLYNALFSKDCEDTIPLTKEDLYNSVVSYSMNICTLFVVNDYVKFFKAIASPQSTIVPGMTVFIDEMTRLIRDSSLRRLLVVFMSPLDRNYLIKALGFNADDTTFREFVSHYKIVFAPDGKINNRDALRVIASIPPPQVSILYKR